MRVVVDTNVAMVAEGKAGQADPDCRDECVRRLFHLSQAGQVVLDDKHEILGEYLHALGHSGKPGMGAKFVKWVSDHRYTNRCVLVRITGPREAGWRVYEEVPEDDELAGFDRDDQKFVAVACAARADEVWNAVDSDWWQHRGALTRLQVTVNFLCPHLMDQPRTRSR